MLAPVDNCHEQPDHQPADHDEHFMVGHRAALLGALVGVEDFQGPENVVHQDIVYAEGNPIQVERAVIIHPDGREVVVMDEGKYKI